jgi:polyphosphate kinase
MEKKKYIINRELSWLSFNHRVLQEAEDPNVPLIQRMRFLGIFSNNLDEFFKVRVASIKRMIDLKINPLKITGDKPKNILGEIQKTVIRQQEQFGKIYQTILRELRRENIFIINERQVSKSQGEFLKKYFRENVLTDLSTIMLENVNEFPYLKDKSIYLAVRLSKKDSSQKPDYALIEVPSKVLSRFVIIPSDGEGKYIILLDDVIRYGLSDVFSMFDYDTFEAYTIKLTRDAELDIDNDVNKSFLEKIANGVNSRKEGQPVRFLYDMTTPKDLFDFIMKKMQFDDHDNVIAGGRYHNFKDFMNFPNPDRNDLEYKPIVPIIHPLLKDNKNALDVIAKNDFILHYPYHNFSQFINMLRDASIDPNVTTIRTTIYRVADKSKVVYALINAARNGKKVIVNIELQARFDEKANIYYSNKLEEVGAKVLIGVDGLKVHSKLTQVTRKENKKLVHYTCVSTGNSHEGTAKIYSDISMFTTDTRISGDAKKIFDLFENTYYNYAFKHFLVSPINMRRRLNMLINNEIKNAKANKDAYIILKINNLVDKEIIYKLYEASNAGVKIKLIARGICSLIPGIKGMSENIEAISIVDKFLEHTRILLFCNNNDERMYITSADLMVRNLDNRIETASPVYNDKLKDEIKKLFDIQLHDNVKARVINEKQENNYKKKTSKKAIRSQIELYNFYKNKSY